MHVLRAVALMALVIALMPRSEAGATPAVVVSIKPVHALVAGVMAGVGEPVLLLRGATSPHAYALRPSDAAAIEGADVVLWIGPQIETFLSRPLAALSPGARLVTLIDEANLILYPARRGGVWDEHAHDADGGHHDGSAYDGHVWLDPENARRIVAAAVAALSAEDPAHAATYTSNGARLDAELAGLDAELLAQLAAARGVPYLVFHDAYQYFEQRYGLAPVGSVTVQPDRGPGGKRLAAIRERILNDRVSCVFREPQFEPDLVETLIRGTGARLGVLDPLGADIPAGRDAYVTLLRRLAGALKACLAPGA